MMAQNTVNNRFFNGRGEIGIGGAKFLNGSVFPLANGTVDIYTAPSGKRAAILGCNIYNTTAGSLTYTLKQKVSSLYYNISATLTAGATAQANPTFYPVVLEPGESFSVTTSGSGLNFSANILEFDSYFPMYSPKILNLANGNNTLYLSRR
jgi:hypothetical protein